MSKLMALAHQFQGPELPASRHPATHRSVASVAMARHLLDHFDPGAQSSLGVAAQPQAASPAACIQRHQAHATDATDEKKAGANRPRNFTPEHRFSQVLGASASL
jgi:hypothetical protein